MHPDLDKLVAAGKISASSAARLSDLAPGTFCLHPSWGPGRIATWDLSGDWLTVDFESKPGHEMKLDFAAKSLDPLPPDHLLARRVADRPSLVAMAEKSPADLVRLALQSHGGSLTLDKFEALIKPKIVSEAKFKSWWESTKRALRSDKSFVVPAKRNLALELRAEGLGHADALVGDFLAANDLKQKVKAAEAIAANLPAFTSPATQLQEVALGLDSAATKSLRLQPATAFELLLVRDELFEKVPPLREGKSEWLELAAAMVQESRALRDVVKGLPVARTRQLLAAYPAAFGDGWLTEALARINDSTGRPLEEVANFLAARGKSDELVIFLQTNIQNRSLSFDALQWVCRERKGAAFEVFDSDFAPAILSALECEHYEESARRSGRLRDLVVSDRDLLGDLALELDPSQAKTFARRLWMSPVFDELTRRSLLARIIKVAPEVQDIIEHPENEDDHSDDVLVVSTSSLEARQAAYDRLLKVEIPQNTKDIQIARSYGDLRENFEFKAAKEQQRVLMRRQRVTERELQKARATDFKDAPTHVVTIGTIVDYEENGAGTPETVTILGAWDSDPEKRIVSYLSGMAKALIGKAVGDVCEIPTEHGSSRAVTIRSIRRWAE
jgi:transcription elongation GreA/GreB family factor